MPLETGSFINDLTPSNPPNSDPAGQGDDHLRLIKTCVQGTFPNMGAVFGQVRSQDVAASISSTWNTNHLFVGMSVTATVVLALPPSASITTGFSLLITSRLGATSVLTVQAGSSINGTTSLSIPQLSTAHAYYVGAGDWRCDVMPNGQGGSWLFGGDVVVAGTTSLSGAVTMKSTLSISGAVAMGTTLLVTGVLTAGSATSLGGNVSISGQCILQSGQIVFPATQNLSAGANTLDDYEEGTWTPAFAFVTPGTSAFAYTTQTGIYTKIGDTVVAQVSINTSTFTVGTAAGNLQLNGFPFTNGAASTATAGMIAGFNPVGIYAAPSIPQLGFQLLTANNFGLLIACDNGATGGATVMGAAVGMLTGINKFIRLTFVYKV